ncbi:hypothetical protein [Arthrobacter sp.]|uniref:hypothetical protein n=1 Tax=Arthrobacter sp. TaxID=1667 RepID=UPI002811E205|nr:hypothetical protein [Arthrobacter sp.]
MSMPTPSNHRLPQPPPVPPRKTPEAVPPPPLSETTSVIERLKAARPKTPVPSDDRDATSTTATVAAPSDAPVTAPTPSSPPAGGTSDSGPTGRPGQERPGQERQDQGADATPSKTREEELKAARAEKLRTASSAASAWAAQSGKRTAQWTASASRSAAANVRSWPLDVVRRILVTVVVLGSLAGTAWAAGLFGGTEIWTVDLFRPDLSLLSPHRYALAIWALIGLGLVGYVVHQWLPGESNSPRHRRLGWVVMAAVLLNFGLALMISAGLYLESLILHGVLLVLLLFSLRWLNRWPAATSTEGSLVDVPLGLFLGWTGFTALSHCAAVLSLNGFSWLWDDDFRWALVGLGIVVVIGSVVCSTDRGRIAVALAVVWGIGWIVVERIIGQPQSLLIAGTAALAAFLLLITSGSRRHRVDHSYRRALRRRQTANLPPLNLDDEDDDDDFYDEYPGRFGRPDDRR